MDQPSNLLLKFSRRLLSDPVDRERFIEALVHPQALCPAILWCRDRVSSPFPEEPPLSWQPDFVQRLTVGTRPGQHPLHNQGWFYCLDLSSAFAASVWLDLPSQPQLVFDMCASPGGKSLFAWRSLRPHRLISNEVIGKRTAALISNLRRCSISGTQRESKEQPLPSERLVLSLDSKPLTQMLPQVADLVIVDAPCTGQSLLAKGKKAPGCFHSVNINRNAGRQKRILANSAQLVAPQGHLAYMTCAYSVEENERVSTWFLDRFPDFQAIAVPRLAAHQSTLVDLPCYRMWPQDGLGAGAFTILFQNRATGAHQALPAEFFEHPRLTVL